MTATKMPKHKHHKFWMIYSPQGSAPTAMHLTRWDADMEAERLAEANPGREFYVLKAVNGRCAPKLAVGKIAICGKHPEAGIPF